MTHPNGTRPPSTSEVERCAMIRAHVEKIMRKLAKQPDTPPQTGRRV